MKVLIQVVEQSSYAALRVYLVLGDQFTGPDDFRSFAERPGYFNDLDIESELLVRLHSHVWTIQII